MISARQRRAISWIVAYWRALSEGRGVCIIAERRAMEIVGLVPSVGACSGGRLPPVFAGSSVVMARVVGEMHADYDRITRADNPSQPSLFSNDLGNFGDQPRSNHSNERHRSVPCGIHNGGSK